jgi:Na+/melibiose symporter-like transporter
LTDDAKAPGSKRLSLSAILTFSTTNLPLSALGVAVFVYLPPYFARHLGVSLTVVGGVWAMVRMIDVGIDPILGLVMDRTRTPIGRYRVWMIAGAPILMLGLYKLFMAPVGMNAGYLVAWLLVMYLGISIMSLAQSAWGARLAPQYDERSRLFGVLTMVGVAGTMAALAIPIIARPLGRSDAWSVQAMGWLAIALTPVTAAIVALRTPERIARDASRHSFALKDYWTLLVKPDLVRMYLAQMATTLGPGWMAALYLFFFQSSRGFSQQQATILLSVYILAGAPGAMLAAAMAGRIGKHRTLMVNTTAYALGLSTALMIPRGNVLAALPLMVWCGALASGFGLMIQAMLADVGDEVRLGQGKERISLIYALNNVAGKIAAALAIALTFPLLDRLGFKAAEGAVNTPGAIHNLEMAFLIGPVVFVMLGGACVIGWRLDARRHAVIRGELEAQDALMDGAPTPVWPRAAVPPLDPEISG